MINQTHDAIPDLSDLLDYRSQLDWPDIYRLSGYKTATLAEMAGIGDGSLYKYLRNERTPRKANLEKMVKVMKIARELPRLKFHPSYGYATPEQVERLRTMGAGPDMDLLLRQIEEQTKNRGKFK